MTVSKKRKKKQVRTVVSSTRSELYEHIRSLGLETIDEYMEWCRVHGLVFHRRKTWREEREEREIAEQERKEAEILKHVQALGLQTLDEYLEWCRRNGFRADLEKKGRQRQKELMFVEKEKQGKGKKGKGKVRVTLEHVRELGLESIEDYRLWCLENGLSERLEKKPEQLRRELAVSTLTRARRQTERLPDVIRQIAAGEVGEVELKRVLLSRIHAGFAGLEGADREAMLALLLRVEEVSDLISTAPGDLFRGQEPGNTCVDGVVALGRWQREWIRGVEEWKPESRHPQTQFASLVRHLCARYEVPGFMDAVWFAGADEEARRRQRWFLHIGAGQNIRTADVPVQLSKKMAHQFLQAPEDCTVEEALRWGQILGQGGTPDLVDAVNATRLGRSLEDEAFWSTVVQFLVRHPELDANAVGLIIEYIHHRKFAASEVIGEGGKLEYGPPPEPNFSMKSRSLPKLIAQVNRWQKTWVREEMVPEEKKEPVKRERIAHFYLEEEDDRTGRMLIWSIQELKTARALANEGEAMRHCVGTYANKLDKNTLWSLQVRDGERTRRILTIQIEDATRTATQVRGRFNANPEKEFDEAAMGWEGQERGRGRLNRADRYYLRRAHKILHLWLEREEISYSLNRG